MKSSEDGLLVNSQDKKSEHSNENYRKSTHSSNDNKEDESLDKLNKAFVDNESKKREPILSKANTDKKKKSTYLKVCVILLLSVSQVRLI